MIEKSLSVYLEYPDNDIKVLPDISYERWEEFLFHEGGSDIGWMNYCREHDFHEIMSFNDSLKEATLIFKDNVGGRILKFKLISDSDYD